MHTKLKQYYDELTEVKHKSFQWWLQPKVTQLHKL